MIGEKKFFLWVLIFSSCIRLLFASLVPITGDEAYFIVWAKHLNYGYYEHPPMIGWIMWLLSFLGDNIFVYRIFPLISVPIIALLMVKILQEFDEKKAYLCGSVFLLSPVSILNVLSVNDVPLIFFTFLSGFFFYRAVKKNKITDAILSGFSGGCAFLSKYFFVLFILALLGFCTISRKKELWKVFSFFMFAALPLMFINLLWNYNNCWLNVMFNLFFRNKNLSIDFANVFIFIIEQIFLMTPFLAFVFFKDRFFWRKVKENKNIILFWYFFIVPLVFFSILSLTKKIGLHWMASFYPFFFILLIFSNEKIIKKAIRYNVYFSVIFSILVMTIVFLPVETFRSLKKYPEIVMFMKPVDLCKKICERADDRILASTGYTETSVFSYYCNREFVLFGSMSRSGRYFDFISDFRDYDGRNFLIVSLNERDTNRFAELFKKINVEIIETYGARFFFIYGDSFIFNNYRELFLRKLLDAYYSFPFCFPSGRNFFRERYFPENLFSK
ncbi:MAG: glycosyltransferase family 39 protein [Candidatus Omnitrophica bacterium]|nr:glycosyltransferase family 39 protein [Candidatus Omnitrophota bacterium]